MKKNCPSSDTPEIAMVRPCCCGIMTPLYTVASRGEEQCRPKLCWYKNLVGSTDTCTRFGQCGCFPPDPPELKIPACYSCRLSFFISLSGQTQKGDSRRSKRQRSTTAFSAPRVCIFDIFGAGKYVRATNPKRRSYLGNFQSVRWRTEGVPGKLV
jgi:hypothetical protein